jgi:biopolymer transport protein ExbD
MAIARPGRRLLTGVPLKLVQSKVEGGGRRSVDAPIALIPFIDFLVTLVVFLLSSFGASDLHTPRAGLDLPDAGHVETLESAPIIAVDADVITVDQQRVEDTRTLMQSAQIERVEPVVAELTRQRLNWPILHPHEDFPGAVIIQADRRVDFRVIKKLLFSAAQAGYPNVSFAVNERVSRR